MSKIEGIHKKKPQPKFYWKAFSDLKQIEKHIICPKILENFQNRLKCHGLEQDYQVRSENYTIDFFELNQGNANTPSQEKQKKFQEMLSSLNKKFTFQTVRGIVDGSLVDVTTIETINTQYVSEKTSITKRIPENVQQCWDNFNKEIQDYIIQCVSIFASPNDISHIVNEGKKDGLLFFMLGAMPLSDIPQISMVPVRLPPLNVAQQSDVNRQYYNLINVLKFQRKDNQYRYPLQDKYFSLNDIKPALDALEKEKLLAEFKSLTNRLRTKLDRYTSKREQKIESRSYNFLFRFFTGASGDNDYFNRFSKYFGGVSGKDKNEAVTDLNAFIQHVDENSLIPAALIIRLTTTHKKALSQGELGKLYSNQIKHRLEPILRMDPALQEQKLHQGAYKLGGNLNV
jgi:hypothetical protein